LLPIGNDGGSSQDYVLVMGVLAGALCDKGIWGFEGRNAEISFIFRRFLKSTSGEKKLVILLKTQAK